MPVRTPGAIGSSSTPIRSASSPYAAISRGTVDESTIPSSAASPRNPRRKTPSSSPVRCVSVAIRQCSRSVAPSNSPKTVWVLPTSIASSIDGSVDGRPPRSASDVGGEVLAGEGGEGGDEVGRRPLEDNPAAVVAGAGAEVDDPVGVRHDPLVVLDDDDRLAGVDEPVEQAEQLLDVGEVEADGRLVEDVDAALLGHLGGELEPLPLAAGPGGERLAEGEVAEPDVGEPVEDDVRGRRLCLAGAEELRGLGGRH